MPRRLIVPLQFRHLTHNPGANCRANKQRNHQHWFVLPHIRHAVECAPLSWSVSTMGMYAFLTRVLYMCLSVLSTSPLNAHYLYEHTRWYIYWQECAEAYSTRFQDSWTTLLFGFHIFVELYTCYFFLVRAEINKLNVFWQLNNMLQYVATK